MCTLFSVSFMKIFFLPTGVTCVSFSVSVQPVFVAARSVISFTAKKKEAVYLSDRTRPTPCASTTRWPALGRSRTPHGPAGGGNGRSLDAGETTPYLPVIVDGGVGVRSPETPHARPAPGHRIADPNLLGTLSPIHLSPRSLPENIPPALRRARSETPILDPTVRGCMIAASKAPMAKKI